MKNLEETIEKLNKYGQTHIVKDYGKIDRRRKEKIIRSNSKTRFLKNIKNLYNELTKRRSKCRKEN